MTKQSKITLAIVGVVLVAFLGGYFGGMAGGGEASASSSSTENTLMDDIKERGVLRIGCADAPPTNVVLPDGTCEGPELIPAQQFAAALGVEFQTIATTYQNIIAGLDADKYDIATNLDTTAQRSTAVRFSDPIWSYPGVFVVKTDTQYRTSKQIMDSGEPIATAQGSSFDQALTGMEANTLRVDTYKSASAAVTAGRSIALFTDLGTAVDIATKDRSFGIVVPEPALVVRNVADAFRLHTDEVTIDAYNIAVNNAVVEGTITREFAAAGYLDVSELGDLRIN
jgi:polar amino acid transport system substrate-binding protein